MRIKDCVKRTLSRVLMIGVSCVALAGAALAQVPTSAPPPIQLSTFRAAVTALQAPLGGTGDLFCIQGSASRLIKVKQITVSGSDTTAQVYSFALVKRSTANSGGTSTVPVAVPLDTTQNVTAATATLAAYTVVPSSPGTLVGNIGARAVSFATGATPSTTWSWDPTQLYSDVRLRGVAQSMCLNAPAAFTTAGPLLAIEVTWTEN